MSETTLPTDGLVAPPAGRAGEPRRLRGNLGVASIVFMVVAAAAPLGVIGGVVPLGIAAGNGAGFPATFIVSTVILLFFAVGFTALTPYVEDAGAFFSYVRTVAGLSRRYRHRVRRASSATWRSKRASTACSVLRARAIVELFGGPALPWWVFAAVAFAVTTFLGYRNIELSSRVLAVLLTAEIAIVVGARSGDRRPGRRPRAVDRHRQPERHLLRIAGHRTAVRDHQLRRLRGHRDLPRRGHARRNAPFRAPPTSR